MRNQCVAAVLGGGGASRNRNGALNHTSNTAHNFTQPTHTLHPAVGNIKRYHIGKVYRRDQPQMNRGRFR